MKPGYVYILTNKPMGVLYIGVTDDLVRINVGLEDIEDLQEDFAQALDAR